MFFHNIYLYIKNLSVYEIIRKFFFTKIFANVIINRRLSKLNKNIQGNRIKF